MTTKTVNALNAMLTRVRNELKYHDTPSSPDDKFGNNMSVSFHFLIDFLVMIFLCWNLIRICQLFFQYI